MQRRISVRILSLTMLCLLFVILSMVTCARKGDLELGIDALNKGEYGKAIKSLRSALVKDSLNPEIHYNLCLAYVHVDSAESALTHYLRLTKSGSSLKDDRSMRESIAVALGVEPYPSSIISMRRLNQFKGTFSPTGDVIALAASPRDRADIYLANLDGSNIRKIISGGMNTDLDFSPDGGSIVFVSDRDGDEDLYLYDIATKETQVLTDNLAQDFAPSFAPDGGEVVFVSNMDNLHQWEIYAINVKTKHMRRLTNNNYWDGFPRFSANGLSIVFSSKRDGSEDIYVMRRDGGAEAVLFASPADDNDPTMVEDNLFFKSQMDGEWEIYQYNVMTKKLVRLTNNPWADWSPNVSDDGMRILASRKIKGRWVLHFINLKDPVTADFLAAEIQKKQL